MNTLKKLHRSISGPIVIVGILFFVFGFITWLSAVLIPYLKIACELNNFESYLVAFSFYIAYLFMSIPAGWFLEYSGYKRGMVAGLIIMAAGSLIFVPAALTRTYGFFLAGLFIQGAGMALLQTASNPYVTIIGPIESAARRISIMGICNGVAGVLAPAILGFIALNGVDGITQKISTMSAEQKSLELDALASRVVVPYVLIMISLLLLAVFLHYSNLPDIDGEEENTDCGERIPEKKKTVFQFPHLLLGVIAIFLYTGVEVIAGNTIIGYGVFLDIPMATARFFSSFTLFAMLLGYTIGIITIPKYLKQKNALILSAIFGLIFILMALLTRGFTSVMFIALLGLANSLMWPSIWPLAIAGLGRFTKIGSSMMVMAISGAAIIPLLYGRLTDISTPKTAYRIVIPIYLFILFYAVRGHRIRRKRKKCIRNIKNLLLLLILLPCNSFSQNTYQIGTSQESIEPGDSSVSLSLGGYAAPWEGRFSLQWKNKGLLSDVTAIAGVSGKLYFVSAGHLFRVEAAGPVLTWEKAGEANNIRLIAGSDNKLFAVTEERELFESDLERKKIRWNKIGVVNHPVKALAASENKLYAAGEDGSVWVADVLKGNPEWRKIESLKLKNMISLAVGNKKLIAMTEENILYQSDVSSGAYNWIKAAYKNGITIKEDIRHIILVGNTIYGVSAENVLYKGEHRSEGNLSARAIAVKDKNNTIVVVSVDVVGLNDQFVGSIKSEISKTKGIPPAAVFVNISHTHFAPVTQDWATWQEHNHRPDSIYLYSTVRKGILHAVDKAISKMYPAELFFGRGETDIGYNRSLKDHQELYDHDVDVIKIDYTNNDAENYLFIAACHPVFSTAGKFHYTLSANYPGVARKLIEERTGATNAVFLQGTAGDINPRDNGEQITGEKLANEVISVIGKQMNRITGPITFYLDTIHIPITPMTKEEVIAFREQNRNKPGDMVAERNLNWCDLMLDHYVKNKMPSSLPVYVQTLNIGNWKLVGFSRETTTEYSLGVKSLWPDKMVSVAGYTNDVSSYLPTGKHIKKSNYEGLDSFFWYGIPNVFPATVDSTIISFIRYYKH
ncbi:MAG: glucose/galactose MFS transporter [Prolixibacteraceae bacterium]